MKQEANDGSVLSSRRRALRSAPPIWAIFEEVAPIKGETAQQLIFNRGRCLLRHDHSRQLDV
jgi:hypothetical protein